MSKSNGILSIKKLFKAAGLPGYLLFFYNILIFFVKRRRSLEEYTNIDSSAILQVIYVFIVFGLAFITFIFTKKIKKRIYFLKPNFFLALYIFICFLSALWSNDTFLTLYRSFETLAFLILISWTVYNLSVKLDVQNMIEWVVFWGVWSIFWSIATNVKIIGLEYLSYPFYAARLEYPVVVFFALLLSKRKFFKYIILIFALLSISNKIYLGFALGLIGFLFGNSKSKGLIFSSIFILLFVLLFIDIESILKSTIFIGREEIDLEHMSGRSKVWEIAWAAFLERPFLGYGFVAGESAVLYDNFKGAINMHNFIFSSLIGTGVLGTVFLLYYFTTMLKMGFNKYWPKNNWRVAVIGTLIMSVTVAMSAPGLGGRVYGSWIPIVLIFTIIGALNYKFRKEKRIK